MIISAGNNSELENIMMPYFDDLQISADDHLGRSWETLSKLPKIDGCIWQVHVMFGTRRALLKKSLPSEGEMMELLHSAEWIKSSVYGKMAAAMPFDFRILHNLSYVQMVKRGWITLKAVWEAPDGETYIFRQEMSGTVGYCTVYRQ